MSGRNRAHSDVKGLTVRENLLISPIEKHIYYNKFPWTMVINIALVVLVTTQVWFIFDYEAGYARQQYWAFRYMFMDETDDHTPVINFNTPSDFQQHLFMVQNTFQTLNNYMFQDVDLDSISLNILGYDKELGAVESFPVNINDGFVTEAFNVNDMTSLKLFLENIAQMTIVASNMTFVNNQNSPVQMCQTFTVQLLYDLHEFSQILFTMNTFSATCGSPSSVNSTVVGISFAIFILGFVLLLMAGKKINTVSRVFIQLKASYINFITSGKQKDKDELDQTAKELDGAAETNNARETFREYLQYSSWEDVPMSAKMKFFSPWFFFNIVGNILQMLSSLIVIIIFFAPVDADSFFIAGGVLGFSAFFSWTQLLQYLKYWKDIILVTTTLTASGPAAKTYFGIVIPLFFGFSVLAYSLFWKYTAFRTFGMSMRSLFAMAGGDIVHQTYLDTWDEGVISSLFFTVYMVTFFTAFMNIFVAVIMDGYDKGRLRQQLDDDDPFPSADSLMKKQTAQLKKSNTNLPDWTEEEKEEVLLKDSTYDLKGKIEKLLSNPDLDISAKNLINLLLFYNLQIKMNITKLVKVRDQLSEMDDDKTAQAFLERLLDGSFHKLSELIFYHRLALKNNVGATK